MSPDRREPPKGQDASAARLLGLAFAAADLAMEVDGDGRIAFAAGAAQALTGASEAALAGRDWTSLVEEADRPLLEALQDARPGERLGPVRAALTGGACAAVSVFRYRPDALSCALVRTGPVTPALTRTGDGLLASESFEAAAAALAAQARGEGTAVRLDLVELKGLSAKTEGLDAEQSAALRRKVAGALRALSFAGAGASEVAPDRFALVGPAGQAPERLAARLAEAAGPGVAAEAHGLAPSDDGTGFDARALRFALDRFIEDGPKAAAEGFAGAMAQVVRDSDRFRAAVAGRTFQLAYQPVVSLADGRLHHFEALTRFTADASPAEAIRLAEELELILDFDIAVARKVAAKLTETSREISIAANLSAFSLMQPVFIEVLMASAPNAALRKRMLLEVTETRKLEDLDAAEAVLRRLREAGFLVCLDDFGAGAASLDYLRRLTVDFVKIDGRFVRDIAAGGREAVLVRHVANLCKELGLRTVAEMIETDEAAELVRGLGVTLGQGYAFGRATPEPIYAAPAPPPPVRRAGATEQWR